MSLSILKSNINSVIFIDCIRVCLVAVVVVVEKLKSVVQFGLAAFHLAVCH